MISESSCSRHPDGGLPESRRSRYSPATSDRSPTRLARGPTARCRRAWRSLRASITAHSREQGNARSGSHLGKTGGSEKGSVSVTEAFWDHQPSHQPSRTTKHHKSTKPDDRGVSQRSPRISRWQAAAHAYLLTVPSISALAQTATLRFPEGSLRYRFAATVTLAILVSPRRC